MFYKFVLVTCWLYTSKRFYRKFFFSIKISFLKTFAKFTGKHLYQSLFFNKVAPLRLVTLLKKRLWHRCFPVKFAKVLRTPILKNICERLLLFIQILIENSIFAQCNILTVNSDSHVMKIFAKIKFSPALFEKISSFVCLVFKIEKKINFKIAKFVFLKKQADLKTNCTWLWRFALMIIYNMLTLKYYFC